MFRIHRAERLYRAERPMRFPSTTRRMKKVSSLHADSVQTVNGI
ncbi:hypothetical protein RRSWK_05449 [Rhodopirellula sp. SWK7]|nr:hypothetical protein RRSWK_05449 [Rhodopirellula sp. SWK7]